MINIYNQKYSIPYIEYTKKKRRKWYYCCLCKKKKNYGHRKNHGFCIQ